ncbi:MAG: hypothetical protein JWN70_1028 [Planctomycetaceae bacterium]|nr:hypothetical protein [Planctomycetaceae bacterium]
MISSRKSVMAKQLTFEHPEIGLLESEGNDLWTRTLSIVFDGLSWDIPLIIQMDVTDGIEANQVTAYLQYQKQRDAVFHESEEILREYAKASGVANLQKSSLAKRAQPVGIIFPDLRPRPTFGLLFDVTWDIGHGAAIKFVDGQFSEVGQQDIVL